MILQLDAGNSRIKWRLLDPVTGEPAARGVVSHGEPVKLPQGLAPPTQVQLASVAGSEKHGALTGWLQQTFSLPVREAVTSANMGGLRNSYSQPGSMGVDRWLAMLAASHRYAGGVAVLDAGSALTLDYVSADGEHLGGYILPGVGAMARALKQDTARVPFEFDEASPPVPGNSTQSCVNSGLNWVAQQVMMGVHNDMVRFKLAQRVITGGDGRLLCPQPLEATYMEPELVLDGLSRYWQLMDAVERESGR